MSRPTFLTINTSALTHNLKRVRALAPHAKIAAMVKANAYGHGVRHIAPRLKEADALGVASIDEGLLLRELGIQKNILLLEGLFYAEELALAAKQQFSLVVHHEAQLRMLEETKLTHAFPVWLKINTGMNRLGFLPEAVSSVYERLSTLKSVASVILMTHFAEADDPSSPAAQSQIDLFHTCTLDIQAEKSLANSAGILAWKNAHAEWVRPGLMLYGTSPFSDKTGSDFDLHPVMTLHSRLIAISQVKRGAKIGYGGTYAAERDMTIGVIAAGYGDGYPQYAKNGTPVLVTGKLGPLVGRVSMDMITVDLTEHSGAKIDDEVVLWGQGLPVEMVARGAKTSAYELLTRMTQRPKVVTL